ncbi:aspartyl protease family protein 1 [Punica granatum]|uniref:Peptidase A1 domain-containing protein n=2 Tax=Punica granatum TaxID=22663 RepID=A0A218W2K8_PUNGR|nr:aspartyl protease family protein 1 [Punica granatum]OWM66471.1 hypothetical protein CDL15_Pgr013688 [Punica granatum]PKI59918.1 hypothetical protein CRG98_019691 [Punica granatum]
MFHGHPRSWSSELLLPWAFLALLSFAGRGCYGFGTFGFDMHHRFSDPVKGVLDVDDFELPQKGSVPYYASMAHLDRAIHGRRLAQDPTPPLTFSPGNETYRLSSFGFLHYANLTVGTPSSWFLVALDTGSDLFWLPCDCKKCVTALQTSSGQRLDLNIYSPNTSSTSSTVPCNSSICTTQSRCASALSSCPYEVIYLSNGTSSTGILVEDVLHLITDDDQTKAVDARITLGCGQVETGSFLNGAAPNGLFGLGMRNISVPSRLAKEGVAANSFSMCFGPDGMGRISFGDKGSTDQGETPFNLQQPHLTYNVTVTQLSIGGNTTDLEFTAIFDSGTSFTYLNDPAYTLISESFDSVSQDERLPSDSDLPFEYCYAISSNQTSYAYPTVNLTMKGGDQFYANDPTILAKMQDDSYVYCLALVKSGDVNIIGQNFMTGYRIIFDREKMVLGWKASDCYTANNSSVLNIPRTNAAAVPPAIAVNPQATSGGGSGSQTPSNASSCLQLLSCFTFVMILFSFFSTV